MSQFQIPCYCGSNFSLVSKLLNKLNGSWIIIKVLRQRQIKISALKIYCKDCHTTLSVPSLFGHGALYRFFLVLRELLLVSYCVVVWVLFRVFSCFWIMSFGDCTCPQHQETAHYKVWNLPWVTAQNAI